MKAIQSDRRKNLMELYDSLEDTSSEGYCSRKSSDELQYESLSKSISGRMLYEQKSACSSRRNSLMPVNANHGRLVRQNSVDKPSISSIWKTANSKMSAKQIEKTSVHPGRSNSDISMLGKSVLKSALTKKTSHS